MIQGDNKQGEKIMTLKNWVSAVSPNDISAVISEESAKTITQILKGEALGTECSGDCQRSYGPCIHRNFNNV